MNHVFAKVQDGKNNFICKLISDCSIFDINVGDIATLVNYSPTHNLDVDSWFKIEGFSKKTFCLDFISENFDSKNFNDYASGQFDKISYIFSIQEGDFYFQKITSSMFLRKKFLAFGDVFKIENSMNRIIINPLPDAIYLKSQDILIFRDLAKISTIFKGIDELYREATNEEVKRFLSSSFIYLEEGFTAQSVLKSNRKRIALIMERVEKMDVNNVNKLMEYVKPYLIDSNLGIKLMDNKFCIRRDADLKLLIYAIKERFYTTPIGNERRLANSVQDI